MAKIDKPIAVNLRTLVQSKSFIKRVKSQDINRIYLEHL